MGEIIVETRPGRHGALRLIGRTWHPVVYRASGLDSSLTPHERFTVLHEVAHAVVEERLSFRPLRASHYWALERLCDNFAAQALLPEALLAPYRLAVSSAVELRRRVQAISSQFKASYAASARRLLEQLPQGAAWGVRRLTPSRAHQSAVYRVEWVAGAGARHGNTGSHLHPNNPLIAAISGQRNPCQEEGFAIARGGRDFTLVVSWLGERQQVSLPVQEPLALESVNPG